MGKISAITEKAQGPPTDPLDLVRFERFSEQYLKVIPSEHTGELVPLKLNVIQRKLHALAQKALAGGERPWFLVLKSRRPGITSYVQGRIYHQVATQRNLNAVTLAHTSDDTEKIFRIAGRFYDNSPPDLRPYRKGVGSRREQNFPILGSHHWIGTAGGKDFGRGGTLHFVHGSEVAFWPEIKSEAAAGETPNLIAGILRAAQHGEVWMESTANGLGNWFYRECSRALSGDSQFILVFIPWWLDPQNRIPLREGERLDYTQEEHDLVARHGLAADQVKFRRSVQVELRDKFAQEYPEDPVTCFLTSGLRYFTEDVVRELVFQAQGREILESRQDGAVTIWEPPVKGARYVAGADVGEGLPGGARSVLGIINWETGEQVAALAGRWRPDLFAERVVDLCREYNDAFLAVERNNHGHSALNTITNKLGYARLYWQEVGHPRGHERRPGGSRPEKSRKLGWETNAFTRPLMLDELEEAMRKGHLAVNDLAFLNECRTFVDNGSGKYEASPGNLDDRIFAWAIAWQMRKVPTGKVEAYGSREFQGPRGTGTGAHL